MTQQIYECNLELILWLDHQGRDYQSRCKYCPVYYSGLKLNMVEGEEYTVVFHTDTDGNTIVRLWLDNLKDRIAKRKIVIWFSD